MAFRFRLQKVLDYRQKIVDRKSREVGEAARVVAQIQAQIHQVKTDVAALLNDDTRVSAVADIHLLDRKRSWLIHLESRLDSLAQQMEEAAMELAVRRDNLTAAWRDLEVLQKLKQRQKEIWQVEQLRRENQDLDEIGQIRADRQQREKLTRDLAQLA